jgi:5-methylthioadenosine/S-adenosylhomocysteine deaminase
VGPVDGLRRAHPEAREIGGRDVVVIPGLVDGHQHGRGFTYTQRGVADSPLELWLHDLKSAVPNDPYAATLWGALHSLAAGITTSMHSHITLNPKRYSSELSEALRAYRDSRLRTTFAIDIRDRASFTYEDDDVFLARLPGPLREATASLTLADAMPDISEIAETAEALQAETHGTSIQVCLGPEAASRCSEATLVHAREVASRLGTGLHLHCAETGAQRAYFQSRYGMSEVAYLHRLGLLGPDVSLAHCIWLLPGDAEILAGMGVKVVHCPSSNLRLGSGRMRLDELLTAGVEVALGTDSFTLNEDQDLFGEMRLAAYLSRIASRGPAEWRELGARKALEMATSAGAAAALRTERVGSIGPGWKADLVLLDRGQLESPHTVGLPHRLPELLFTRATRGHVRAAVVGGQVAMLEGTFPGIDLEGLAERIATTAVAGGRDRNRLATLRALRRYIRAYLAELGEPGGRWHESPS